MIPIGAVAFDVGIDQEGHLIGVMAGDPKHA